MTEATPCGGTLSTAQVSALKQLIDRRLRDSNVYAEIRQFVAEFSNAAASPIAEAASGDGGDGLAAAEVPAGRSDVDEQELAARSSAPGEVRLDALRERRIIDEVIRSLEAHTDLSETQAARGEAALPGASVSERAEPGKQYLLVKVLGGNQFEAGDGEYEIRLHFGSQRFSSRPVPREEEPAFDATFLVRLSSRFALDSRAAHFERQVMGLRRLLANGTDEPNPIGSQSAELDAATRTALHLVVLRTGPDGRDGPRELVASHLLEWRRLLTGAGGALVSIELSGLGPTGKIRVPVGVLQVRLDLVPGLSEAALSKHGPLVPQKEVDDALRAEVRHFGNGHRRFCSYAKVWWQEFVEANPAFRHRLVKIFAEDEWGEHHPAPTFVRPMRGGRLLDTPRHAARFVSLLPYVREEQVGGGRIEVWHSPHSFLARGQGDCEDHALLLCSLLLGYGLDAFVCVGTARDQPNGEERDHVWVMTRVGKNGRHCVFWESLTGQRIDLEELDGPDSPRLAAIYGRVGCVFNHRGFYANKQLDDRAIRCSFNLEDDLKWKAMDERLLAPMRRLPALTLVAPNLCEPDVAEAVEIALRGLMADERSEQYDLSTQWDHDLSYYLGSALAAYEAERCSGILFSNEEFQEAIKRHIPRGHSFKGYPTVFNHRDPTKMFHALRQSQIARDIIGARADHAHFALRVRVFAYPENVCAVWCMLAVRARFS